MTASTDHNEQVVDQFTQQAEGYARLTRSMAADRPNGLVALMAPAADDIVLDVACGAGSLTFQISPFVKHVTGVDLTPAMIEQAKAEQIEKGVRNVAWKVSNVCPLSFDDAAFSLVACRAAFHHFDRAREVFSEMTRVCRPGGRIAIIDVSPAPDKSAAFDAIERMRDPSHVHAHTTDELRALATGLPVKEVVVQQIVTPNVPLDAVLATSYPVEHSIDDIRQLFKEDAESGRDRLGMNALLADGKLYVSYPMSTLVWSKQ
ncbi:MAG: methyltransferase domain-containing protein [Rhodospirillaceae bacterium]|nr:MAG: methyltransferase domain-containing protein [Rhodospirillaceae bacterium]